jgi:hypothetical protein
MALIEDQNAAAASSEEVHHYDGAVLLSGSLPSQIRFRKAMVAQQSSD